MIVPQETRRPIFLQPSGHFSLLFSNCNNKSLHCNGKYQNVTFTPNKKRSDFPFQLIHNDVKGRSNISNISKAR